MRPSGGLSVVGPKYTLSSTVRSRSTSMKKRAVDGRQTATFATGGGTRGLLAADRGSVPPWYSWRFVAPSPSGSARIVAAVVLPKYANSHQLGRPSESESVPEIR